MSDPRTPDEVSLEQAVAHASRPKSMRNRLLKADLFGADYRRWEA